MNYKKLYDSIVSKAKTRPIPEVKEIHHIVPRACGGLNNKENLVALTPKEHFVCHLLLVKIYINTSYSAKMQRAAFMMVRHGSKNSRVYQAIKEAHVANLRAQTISENQKQAISRSNRGNKARLGMKNSEEHKQKISAGRVSWIPTEETRALWSEQRKGRPAWNKGKTDYKFKNYPKGRKSRGPLSPETIEKMRQSRIAYHAKKRDERNG